MPKKYENITTVTRADKIDRGQLTEEQDVYFLDETLYNERWKTFKVKSKSHR